MCIAPKICRQLSVVEVQVHIIFYCCSYVTDPGASVPVCVEYCKYACLQIVLLHFFRSV